MLSRLCLLLSTILVVDSLRTNNFVFKRRAKYGDALVTTINHATLVHESPRLYCWSPSSTAVTTKKTPSFAAAFNYVLAIATQMGGITGFLYLVQKNVLDRLPAVELEQPYLSELPYIIVPIVVGFMALRSRIFSPLNNMRPRSSEKVFKTVMRDRLRPWWQPPGFMFAIIWSTISVLRTVAATMLYQKTGTLLSQPFLSFMLHLSIGDTWNTINNVENRLGTAFLGSWFVLGSVLYAVYSYYRVLPEAAYVLAPSAVWLTIATFLIYSIWKLNYLSENRPSLFPSKEEGPPTRWRFYTGKDRTPDADAADESSP